jgi:hypothetical protein
LTHRHDRSKATRRWALPLAAAVLGCTAFGACTKESPMDTESSLRERIVASVAKQFDWDADDIVVQPSEALSTAHCRFYRASNRTMPDAGIVHYGLTDDGSLIDGAHDRHAGAEVLRRCGAQAGAEWWARVVTAFEAQASGRPVTPDDKLSISLIGSAGGRYFAPRLTTADGRQGVEFFVIRHATQPFLVKATLPEAGPLDIALTPVK